MTHIQPGAKSRESAAAPPIGRSKGVKEVESAVSQESTLERPAQAQRLKEFLSQAGDDARALQRPGARKPKPPQDAPPSTPVEGQPQRRQPNAEDLAAVEAQYGKEIDALRPARSPEARQAIMETLAFLREQERQASREGRPLEIDGTTPSELYLSQFAKNPNMTDKQLVQISQVSFDQLARTPEQIDDIHRRFPDNQDSDGHRMAVALLASITGLPPEEISRACPDLGLSGSPSGVMWEPDLPQRKLANVLHDTSDFLNNTVVEGEKVTGINYALWGSDDSESSAIESFMSWRNFEETTPKWEPKRRPRPGSAKSRPGGI